MLRNLSFCCAGLALAISTALAADQAPLIDVQPPSTVSTTALPAPSTPAEHWTPPDRKDPFVCEYLGENDCWKPSLPGGGAPYSHDGNWPKRSKTCVVKAGGKPDGDDAPAILAAFEECKTDGHVVFSNTTYYVRSVLNTTGLRHVDVEVNGTLLWSDDIEYWTANSLPIGFQNQTSAWHIGGDYIHFYGHGVGTLDGNGQVWYDCKSGTPCKLNQYVLIPSSREPGQVEYARSPACYYHHRHDRIGHRRFAICSVSNVDDDCGTV